MEIQNLKQIKMEFIKDITEKIKKSINRSKSGAFKSVKIVSFRWEL
jgi:hypothetical protein